MTQSAEGVRLPIPFLFAGFTGGQPSNQRLLWNPPMNHIASGPQSRHTLASGVSLVLLAPSESAGRVSRGGYPKAPRPLSF
jgi:hypothetical protein